MNINHVAQKIYDRCDKFREWNGEDFVWKRGLIAWFAKQLHAWVYRKFDVIPF